MNLLMTVVSIVVFALISNFFKSKKVFVILSVFLIFSFYFFLEKSFFPPEGVFPSTENRTYYLCVNYYNLIVDAIKNKKLHIATSKNYPKLEMDNIYRNYTDLFFEDDKYQPLLDASYYKGKVYLYFGITPVLLFYLPFNLITGFYLTDKILGFVLACLSLLAILFLFQKFTKKFDSKPPNIVSILSIFLIGLCSYLPFLLARNRIYEIAIITANLLLVISFLFLYYYLETKNIKKQYVLILLISLCLALSVGARPFYVLHIPLFFVLIVLLKYKQTKNIKEVIKTSVIFLIPCLLYGTVVALYNYLRFDSIFEFGFKYTLNFENHYEQSSSLKDVWIAMKYDLFQLPHLNKNTIFSTVQTKGHLFGNECVAGFIWSFPLIFLFVLFPKYLVNSFNKNRNIFYITILMLFVVCINIFIPGFIGMTTRYFFEYMPFIVILSISLFYYLYDKLQTKRLKNLVIIFFTTVFIFTLFINICLLFCEKNSLYCEPTSVRNYLKTVNFLFNLHLPINL